MPTECKVLYLDGLIYLHQHSKVNVIITLQIRKLKIREIKKLSNAI